MEGIGETLTFEFRLEFSSFDQSLFLREALAENTTFEFSPH